MLVPGASASASACACACASASACASAGASARSRLAGGGFGLVGGRASTAFYSRVGVGFFGRGQKPLKEYIEVSFQQNLKPNSHL